MGIPIRSDGHLSKREWASANHCNRTKIYFFPYISTTPCRQRFSGTRIRCKYVLTRKSKQQPPKRQRSLHKPLCKCLSYVSACRSSVYEIFDFLGAKITFFFAFYKKTRRTNGASPYGSCIIECFVLDIGGRGGCGANYQLRIRNYEQQCGAN